MQGVVVLADLLAGATLRHTHTMTNRMDAPVQLTLSSTSNGAAAVALGIVVDVSICATPVAAGVTRDIVVHVHARTLPAGSPGGAFESTVMLTAATVAGALVQQFSLALRGRVIAPPAAAPAVVPEEDAEEEEEAGAGAAGGGGDGAIVAALLAAAEAAESACGVHAAAARARALAVVCACVCVCSYDG